MADNYYHILEAVKARLETIPGIPPVDVRYELELFEGDRVPLVLVAPAADEPYIRKRTFGLRNWWVYPVAVALVIAKNARVSAGLQDYMALVNTIRNELYQVKLPGVSAVFDTRVRQRAISKFAATVASNYDVTGVIMGYTTNEEAKG